jgi:hypothetical protein
MWRAGSVQIANNLFFFKQTHRRFTQQINMAADLDMQLLKRKVGDSAQVEHESAAKTFRAEEEEQLQEQEQEQQLTDIIKASFPAKLRLLPQSGLPALGPSTYVLADCVQLGLLGMSSQQENILCKVRLAPGPAYHAGFQRCWGWHLAPSQSDRQPCMLCPADRRAYGR